MATGAPEVHALEALTEEECCLYAILSDQSGIDLMEFAFPDDTSSDGCWRAMPHQYSWWRSSEPKEVDQGARSLGKSLSILGDASQFPFNFPGEQFVITGPEGIHISRITDLIEQRAKTVRLLREMVERPGGGQVATHKPFKMQFKNGARIEGVLPGKKGTGLKGIHPHTLHVDEGQDLTQAAWDEVPSVVKWELPGARWRVHGVSKGVRDTFYDITSGPMRDREGWHVNHITQQHTILWTEDKRNQYGGPETVAYKRNVQGLHGNSEDRIFVLTRFASCTDDNEDSPYNRDVYHSARLNPGRILYMSGEDPDGRLTGTDEQKATILSILSLPQSHLRNPAWKFWVGIDIGVTSDPTEVIVAAEYLPDAKERAADTRAELGTPPAGESLLRVVTRIRMDQLPIWCQADVVGEIIRHYQPQAVGLDKGGRGVALVDALLTREIAGQLEIADTDLGPIHTGEGRVDARRARKTILRGYDFGARIPISIDWDEVRRQHLEKASPSEIVAKAAKKQHAKDAGTDLLRDLVDTYRLRFPADPDFFREFNAQTVHYASGATIDAYGKRRMSYANNGPDHLLDAGRFLALAYGLRPMEEMAEDEGPERPDFYTQFGWGGE